MPAKALFKLRICIGLFAVLALVLTLGFNVLLSVSTLDRLAIEALLSGYRGAGEHLALGIERGLRFGKPLTKYAGMAEMLRDLRDGAKGIRSAEVLDAGGAVLYSEQHAPLEAVSASRDVTMTEKDREEKHEFDRKALRAPAASQDKMYWVGQDRYRVIIPLRHQGIVGGVALEIDRNHVKAATSGFIRWAVGFLIVACITVCLALTAWIGLLTNTPESRARLSQSLSILLLVLVGGAQLTYSGAMLTLFDTFLTNAMRDKAEIAARFIKRDFEYIIHKGVDVRALKGGEELLTHTLEVHPELGGASLATPDGAVLASAGHVNVQGTVVEESIDAYWPSRFRQREEVLRLRLYVDPRPVTDSVRALGLDLGTSLVISLLLLMELARILGMLSTRMTHSLLMTTSNELPSPMASAAVQTLRVAGFLFFLSYDMGISFIPLLARTLRAPSWGLSPEVLLGLPISAEMVCAGLALLSAGMFSERIGWKKVFVLGVAASCVGLVTGGAATSLVGLIVARGVAGFGFGLVLMAAQIGTLTTEKAGSGLAGVFAGIFSGSICGSAAGALLAERVGFDVVFYVAAALVPLAILPLLFGESTRTDSPTVLTKAETGTAAAAWKFLRDPRMHLLLAMIGIPAALCLTGFLHYMLPLMLSDAQATQSDIGRVFMLYGLCFITVGPVIGKWLDHSGDKTLFAMFTGLFSGAALLVAAASSSLIATGFAVVLIGIAQCLAAPSTMLCVISLGSARRLGPGKTASIYRTLERVGQVLGPILFGLAMVRFGRPQTLAAAGAGAGALAILFFGVWRFRRPKA